MNDWNEGADVGLAVCVLSLVISGSAREKLERIAPRVAGKLLPFAFAALLVLLVFSTPTLATISTCFWQSQTPEARIRMLSKGLRRLTLKEFLQLAQSAYREGGREAFYTEDAATRAAVALMARRIELHSVRSQPARPALTVLSVGLDSLTPKEADDLIRVEAIERALSLRRRAYVTSHPEVLRAA